MFYNVKWVNFNVILLGETAFEDVSEMINNIRPVLDTLWSLHISALEH